MGWFSSKPNIEEFLKDKIANEKFIGHYFKIPLQKGENETDKEFFVSANKARTEVMNVVLGQSISSINEIKKSVNIFLSIEDEEPHLLVRFSDITKKQEEQVRKKGDVILSVIDPKKKESYLFFPLQSIKAKKMFVNIEFGLVSVFKIKTHEEKTWLKFEGKEPMVEQFDGLQYLYYPLAKRINLYKKYPKIDKQLFGWEFDDFINWIMEKRNANEHMKKYCKAVERLMPELQWKYR
jgi:hypothetical protein